MAHDPHHHDSSGAGFAGGFIGSMMGMIMLILIALVIVIAAFAWRPWTTGGGTTDPVPGNGDGGNGNGNGEESSWYYQQPGFYLIA